MFIKRVDKFLALGLRRKVLYRKFFKRTFDIIISFLGLVCLAPLMFAVAAAIRFDSKGPAIFKSPRVGKNGKVFNCYKFRSMSIEAPKAEATRNIDSGLYLTKVGKVIRKLSIDELPQLFNILTGDMSIIGYRPVVVTEEDLIGYRQGLGVDKYLPGLTGLAQISGRDELTDMQKKAMIDATYCQNITFSNDCRIFFKTIGYVLTKQGIVEGSEPIKVKKAVVVPITYAGLDSHINSNKNDDIGIGA